MSSSATVQPLEQLVTPADGDELFIRDASAGTALESHKWIYWGDLKAAIPAAEQVNANLGDDIESTFVVAHTFGTLDTDVTVFRNSTGAEVYPDITRDAAAVTISFGTYVPSAAEFRALIKKRG